MTASRLNIGFIGGGNMAEALIKGLLSQGQMPDSIWVADPVVERQELMRDVYRVSVAEDNCTVVDRCNTVLLAIKPQMVDSVVPELANVFTDEHLLVSILAGTSTAQLERLLGGRPKVVRVMPNTPALIGAGVSAQAAGSFTDEDDLDAASRLLGTVGSVLTVEEAQLDAVTGLSGSGPAYIFSVIEALADGGVREGLSAEVALELAIQTTLGAAQLVAETGEAPAALREKVCSPGGTTLAGLTALDDGNFRGILIEAVARATQRSKELGGG